MPPVKSNRKFTPDEILALITESEDAVESIISNGETKNTEFKIKLPPPIILARVLSSFANTEGGLLLLGINDLGNAEGL